MNYLSFQTRPRVPLSHVQRCPSSQGLRSNSRLGCSELGALNFVHYHTNTPVPPEEGGSVDIKAVHLLSDNRLAFQSLRPLDCAGLFAPRQIASQPRFVWGNLSARTYLHCGPRTGNEGSVVSHAKSPGLTNCPVHRRFTPQSVGGLVPLEPSPLERSTLLELQFLHALEWNLSVTEEGILEQSSCIYW
jgi:hypothetical protein